MDEKILPVFVSEQERRNLTFAYVRRFRQKLCYFVASFAASFVLSMALSIFSPAFSAGPFSGHALDATATAARPRTMMMFRRIFIATIMTDFTGRIPLDLADRDCIQDAALEESKPKIIAIACRMQYSHVTELS
jgi:hypothetical protein